MLLKSLVLNERLTHIKVKGQIKILPGNHESYKESKTCDVTASPWQVTSLDKVVMEGLSEEVTVAET